MNKNEFLRKPYLLTTLSIFSSFYWQSLNVTWLHFLIETTFFQNLCQAELNKKVWGNMIFFIGLNRHTQCIDFLYLVRDTNNVNRICRIFRIIEKVILTLFFWKVNDANDKLFFFFFLTGYWRKNAWYFLDNCNFLFVFWEKVTPLFLYFFKSAFLSGNKQSIAYCFFLKNELLFLLIFFFFFC